MSDTRIGYMCSVDFDWELSEVVDSSPVYSTVEDLKRQRSCWKQCGITKVEVKRIEIIEPENREWSKK